MLRIASKGLGGERVGDCRSERTRTSPAAGETATRLVTSRNEKSRGRGRGDSHKRKGTTSSSVIVHSLAAHHPLLMPNLCHDS
jgi:hypothetical protein